MKRLTIRAACARWRGALATAALLTLAMLGAPTMAAEQQPDVTGTLPPARTISVAAADKASHFVPLGVGKSVVLDLPRDIKDVLVADPTIANAIVRSSRRIYLIGVKVGQTNVFVFDANGQQIAGFDIAVTRDLNGLRAALKSGFPNADIKVEGIGDGIVLSGTAANNAEAQQAYDLASRLAADKVVNNIVVRGRDQVMLKVTVAEVQRDIVKQLGIDLNGTLGYGTATLDFSTANPFQLAQSPGSTVIGSWGSVHATLKALEKAGVLHTLAEPNLTAISGEAATFMAGGEFPVPSGLSCDTAGLCNISISFKKFGVGLNFTPVVLGDGRISLKVMSEVSDLSSENAINLQQMGTKIPVPAISVRRAETTVEIPSGGALAMAGMIQQKTKQQISGFPGLMKLPVLGTLFKSREYLSNTTELMVIVTPYIVRAVAQKDLAKPDDGFADPSDTSAILLGRLNRIYGVPGRVDPRNLYHGRYGFIID